MQRSTSFGVPNANSIKQMLLDWCRAKTRGYEVSPVELLSLAPSSENDLAAITALAGSMKTMLRWED